MPRDSMGREWTPFVPARRMGTGEATLGGAVRTCHTPVWAGSLGWLRLGWEKWK